jgi:hypothetical protein
MPVSQPEEAMIAQIIHKDFGALLTILVAPQGTVIGG